MTRHAQLAEALYMIAQADHYMIGLVERVTAEEVDQAEQLLINRQNALIADPITHARIDLAFSLIDQWRAAERQR